MTSKAHWFKNAMRGRVAGKIRSQVESVFTKVKFVIRILLRLNYALIGFCIRTFMNTVSTKNRKDGTKNCAMHSPVLELAPSRSVVLCLHNTTTNMLNPAQFFSLFTFV